MKKEKIEITLQEQGNEFYNPAYAGNGGGYDQPYVEFEFAGLTGEYEDTSCGDFGTRMYAKCGRKAAYWGTMLQCREVYTDFSEEEDADFLDAFYNEFGISIPTR